MLLLLLLLLLRDDRFAWFERHRHDRRAVGERALLLTPTGFDRGRIIAHDGSIDEQPQIEIGPRGEARAEEGLERADGAALHELVVRHRDVLAAAHAGCLHRQAHVFPLAARREPPRQQCRGGGGRRGRGCHGRSGGGVCDDRLLHLWRSRGRSRLLHDGRSGRWRHGGSGTAGFGWLIGREQWQHGRVIKWRHHIRVVPPKHLAAVQKPDIYAAAADVKL